MLKIQTILKARYHLYLFEENLNYLRTCYNGVFVLMQQIFEGLSL